MHLSHSIQTLTTLYLTWNEIGDEGAYHLSNALQQNSVRLVLYSSVSCVSVPFDTGTCHIESWKQYYR
jgi:hypothetical protein